MLEGNVMSPTMSSYYHSHNGHWLSPTGIGLLVWVLALDLVADQVPATAMGAWEAWVMLLDEV